jgi:hypothetical protein
MLEIAHRTEAQLHDPVAGTTLHVDDERDATGVVLEPGVVQAAGGGLLVHHLLGHSNGRMAGDGVGPAAVGPD